MIMLSKILTAFAAVILVIFFLSARVFGYGSFESQDASALLLLAIAIRLHDKP